MIGWCVAGHPHDPVKGCRICWLLRHEGNVDHTHHASAAGVEANLAVHGTPMGDARWRRGAAMSTWGNDREGANEYEIMVNERELRAFFAPPHPSPSWVTALEQLGIPVRLDEALYAVHLTIRPSNRHAHAIADFAEDRVRARATVEVLPSLDPDPLVCGVGTLASWRIGEDHGIPAWPSNRAMMCAHADRQVGRTVPPILRPAYDGEGYPLREAMRGGIVHVTQNGRPVLTMRTTTLRNPQRMHGEAIINAKPDDAVNVLGHTFTIPRDGLYRVSVTLPGGIQIVQVSDDNNPIAVTSPTA